MVEGKSSNIGIALIVIGVVLLLIVFYAGFQTYKSYSLSANLQETNAVQVLGVSAQILIRLLIKIAFLGVSLAAGSVILSKGVDLVKACPSEK